MSYTVKSWDSTGEIITKGKKLFLASCLLCLDFVDESGNERLDEARLSPHPSLSFFLSRFPLIPLSLPALFLLSSLCIYSLQSMITFPTPLHFVLIFLVWDSVLCSTGCPGYCCVYQLLFNLLYIAFGSCLVFFAVTGICYTEGHSLPYGNTSELEPTFSFASYLLFLRMCWGFFKETLNFHVDDTTITQLLLCRYAV